MLGGVACPKCGADGTAAANRLLAEQLQAVKAAVARSNPPVAANPTRVAAAAPSVARISVSAPVQPAVAATITPAAHSTAPSGAGTRLPGQLDRDRAEKEALAKVMWGDDPSEVAKFLQMHGYGAEEARDTLAAMLKDRTDTVRKSGAGKMITGVAMMCVPVVAFVVFTLIGVFPLKIFGLTLAVGAWGMWRAISGLVMFLSPKSEKGDVSEM